MFKKFFLLILVFINVKSALDKSRILHDVIFKGASVLPYAYNEKDQTIYFLLGKNSQQNYGDFGRRAAPKYLNHPTWMAAHALFRDTAGLIGDYDFIRLYIASKNPEVYKIVNVDQVLYIANFSFIDNIDKLFQEKIKNKHNQKTEVESLVWVSVDELESALVHEINFVKTKDGNAVNLKIAAAKFLRNYAFNTIKNLKNYSSKFKAKPKLTVIIEEEENKEE